MNLYRDPRTAAALIGQDLWPLVDPGLLKARTGGQYGGQYGGRPGDGRAGSKKDAVPLRAMAELIDRLERM